MLLIQITCQIAKKVVPGDSKKLKYKISLWKKAKFVAHNNKENQKICEINHNFNTVNIHRTRSPI